MESIIIPIALGILLIILGVNNLKGNINSIHWYHRKRVAEEDKAEFGKLMGIGTIICGVGCVLFGLFAGLTELLNQKLFIIIGSVLVVVCMVVGLGISFYAILMLMKWVMFCTLILEIV